MRRVLFVCNQAENRSRTATDIFERDYETRCAAIWPGLPKTLHPEDVRWADLIVCMEERHAREANRRGADVDRIILLVIEDDYLYGADALKALLRERFAAALADPEDWRAQSV